MPTPSPSSGEQAGTDSLCRVSAPVVSSAYNPRRERPVSTFCCSSRLVTVYPSSVRQQPQALFQRTPPFVFSVSVTAMKDPILKRTTSSPKWRTARTSAATATSTAQPSSVGCLTSISFFRRLVACPSSSSLLATVSGHKISVQNRRKGHVWTTFWFFTFVGLREASLDFSNGRLSITTVDVNNIKYE